VLALLIAAEVNNMRNYTEYIWAGDPETPLMLIEHLAHFDDASVRRRVAETGRCTIFGLAKAAGGR
jgi:hypothetical protein